MQGGRRRLGACGSTVILPASGCNHYNVRSCSGVPFQPAGLILRGLSARKFASGRLLFVGSEADQFTESGGKDEFTSAVCLGIAELEALQQDWQRPPLRPRGLVLSVGNRRTQRMMPILDRLARLTDDLVLIPATGADAAQAAAAARP